MKRKKHSALRSRMHGLSLVEVMVSVVIGLVVVGAVLVSYIASGKTSAQQAAYAEMNENAQLGLSLLSRDLLLAGYAKPTGSFTTATTPPVTTFTRTSDGLGPAVFGCNNGFVSANTTGTVACATTAVMPAIEIFYEAEIENTVPTTATPSVPSDCLGNGLTAVGGSYFAYNRYYLFTGASGRSELHCASRQGASGEPLVDNVEAMKFWYGHAGAASPNDRRVVRYVTAGNVSRASFPAVIAVKVCLVIRSSEAVLDMELYPDPLKPPKYLNCDLSEVTITDRFLRRAYFTTVTLRNRMAF